LGFSASNPDAGPGFQLKPAMLRKILDAKMALKFNHLNRPDVKRLREYFAGGGI
jgi:hypothetical protein